MKRFIDTLLLAALIIIGLIIMGRTWSGKTNRDLICNLTIRIESLHRRMKIMEDQWRIYLETEPESKPEPLDRNEWAEPY